MEGLKRIQQLLGEALLTMNKILEESKLSDSRRIISEGEPIIAIRAGHGGIDPHTNKYTTRGKQFAFPLSLPIDLHDVNAGGQKVFYEGVWNRRIAHLVYEGLWTINIPCVKIHHAWEDKKLSKQVAKINHIHKEENPIVLLLELHSNASSSHKATGFEVYTTRGETASDQYATHLYNQIRVLPMRMRNSLQDGDPDREKDFTMISKTWCPAILPEFGFYDNPEDILKIMDEGIMKKYSQMLVNTAKFAYEKQNGRRE